VSAGKSDMLLVHNFIIQVIYLICVNNNGVLKDFYSTWETVIAEINCLSVLNGLTFVNWPLSGHMLSPRITCADDYEKLVTESLEAGCEFAIFCLHLVSYLESLCTSLCTSPII